MIFGRGGGGGVINRVTKEAGFTPLREITLQGGSFGNKRFTADFDQPLSDKVAFRLNGDVRELRQFPELRESGTLRRQPDPDLTLPDKTRRSRSATNTSTTTASPIAASPSFPGQARRCRHLHLLRQSGRQPRASPRESRLGHDRAPGRPLNIRNRTHDRRLRPRLSELCPGRRNRGQDPGSAVGL